MRDTPTYGSLGWYYQEKVPFWAKLIPFPLCMSGAAVVKILERYGYELGAGWAIAILVTGLWGVPLLTSYWLLKIYAPEAFKKLPSESISNRGRGFKLNRSSFPDLRIQLLRSPIVLVTFALILILFGLLAFSILSAKADTNATPIKVADLCQKAQQQQDKYLAVWKSLLIKRSGMDEQYLKQHIQVASAEIECQWVGGISLRVSYTVSYGWARVAQQDQLLLLLYSEYDAYRHLPIKRDHFFEEQEIAAVMAAGIIDVPAVIKPHKSLKYSTEKEALEEFQRKLGGNKPENVQLVYYVPGKLPRIDGDPYMVGGATLSLQNNKCLSGYLNLVTGESKADQTACRFY